MLPFLEEGETEDDEDVDAGERGEGVAGVFFFPFFEGVPVASAAWSCSSLTLVMLRLFCPALFRDVSIGRVFAADIMITGGGVNMI